MTEFAKVTKPVQSTNLGTTCKLQQFHLDQSDIGKRVITYHNADGSVRIKAVRGDGRKFDFDCYADMVLPSTPTEEQVAAEVQRQATLMGGLSTPAKFGIGHITILEDMVRMHGADRVRRELEAVIARK